MGGQHRPQARRRARAHGAPRRSGLDGWRSGSRRSGRPPTRDSHPRSAATPRARASSMSGIALAQSPRSIGQQGPVAEQAVARGPRSRRHVRTATACARSHPLRRVALHEPGDGQHPEGEVAPRAVERARASTAKLGVRQRIVDARAAHGGPQHRPPGLERSRPVRRSAAERAALGDVGESIGLVHHPAASCSHAARTASHGRARSASSLNRSS